MKKKSLWLALPLAAGLMLTACGGSNDAPAENADAASAAPSTQSSSSASSSPAASPSQAASSPAAAGAALTNAQLKKVVAGYFDPEDKAQVFGSKELQAQAGAAGAVVSDAEFTPAKCGIANGIDVEAELKKSNLAVAMVANPKNPSQLVTVTAGSAKDAAQANEAFKKSIDAFDGCEKMTMKTMGLTVKVNSTLKDVDVSAPGKLAVITKTEVKGQKIPGATVMVSDNGLQVQMQAQGMEIDDASLQDMADGAQDLLDSMKSL
ncbi:hypothetical protein GCM10009596_30390 [Arthrobacter rhombi]|uniref:hypothetical protein n=1 Tax=Arthrobacter rhombi TaxID=71253 RepID=UPI0031E3EAE6